MSRDRVYKRIRSGRLHLRIGRDEANRPIILLEDVISYLFQTNILPPSIPSLVEKRKPGRPRGSKNKPKERGPR